MAEPETDTGEVQNGEQPARLPHRVTLDAYAPRDLLDDFDAHSAVVGASTDTVKRLTETEGEL